MIDPGGDLSTPAATTPPVDESHEIPARLLRQWRFVLAASLFVFLLTVASLSPFVPEDSFISFRYAENLAEGHGLTFNQGETPVEGFSNLLWILLCALAHRLGADLPAAMPFVGMVFGALNITLVWMLLRRRAYPPLPGLAVLLLFSLSGPFALYAISGMETPLFSCLLTASIVCAESFLRTGRSRYAIALALIGFLTSLCRPEGILAFPFIVCFLAATRWAKPGDRAHPSAFTRRLLAASLFFSAAVVVYHIWRIDYFGEVLPTPFLSKGGTSSIIQAWMSNMSRYFIRLGYTSAPYGHYYLALTLVAAAGVRISRENSVAQHMDLLAFSLAILYSCVYMNFVDWMPGLRYQAPLVALLLPSIARAAKSIMPSETGTSSHRGRIRTSLVLLAVFTMSAAGIAQMRLQSRGLERCKNQCSKPLAQWLGAVLEADATIAMSDVGVVPYYSRLRTLDIHPRSLLDRDIATHGFSADRLLAQHPEAILLQSNGVYRLDLRPEHAGFEDDPRFAADFRLVGVTRIRWSRDTSYWVYLRRDVHVTNDQLDAFPLGVDNLGRVVERREGSAAAVRVDDGPVLGRIKE